MTDAISYLQQVLAKYQVASGPGSATQRAAEAVAPVVRTWAGAQLASLDYSGSYAKGTAVRGSTDVDLFISLRSTTQGTLKEIYESLAQYIERSGLSVCRQNVSIRTQRNGIEIDLVPGRKQDSQSSDHSLYRRRADTWTKTNVLTHMRYVTDSGRQDEIRLLKIWRNLRAIDFPSFVVELAAIEALSGRLRANLSGNFHAALLWLADSLPSRRLVDPANTANVVSDDLTAAGKASIARAAREAANASYWSQVVW